MVFGNIEFYLYWNLLDSKEFGKEYYLVMRISNKVLREHLINRLEQCKTNLKERDFMIFACNDKSGEYFPNNSLSNNLKDISRRVNYMGKPIESEIYIQNKKYLILGLKSAKIRGYSFYALYPYEKIENELVKKINYLIISVFIFIALAFVIGYRLSETFIYPVKRLEDGIKAIKIRDTEFRIENLQNDEYIQESLLQQKLPELKGYELCFSNKMASAVGGDYFDIIQLDENNICLIIGDVSGHGVASALIMAMTKAIFYHGFKEKKNLADLFADLNAVISAYFFKAPVKKMITLFATVINLPTGEATFLDYGHNFPLKISINGEITELKMINVPIGVLRKMRKKEIDKFIINKGDTIVFYTDGIIEATGNTSEQYGYNRFKENLLEVSNNHSNTIMNSLIANYNKWKDGTEPDDDVTLVVLKRLST